MDVEFHDVSYSVSVPGQRYTSKRILQSICGTFPSKKLTAVLGPSGAGKSTLLNAVSGFKMDGITGIFKVNGFVRNAKEFHKASCYVTQDDIVQPQLTVWEMMEFSANVKLPTHISKEQKYATIKTILSDLALFDHRETRTECLSGGQKKRLSIAVELVNNPTVFFLDEPTTGLDDVSTKYCIQLLRTLSRQGRTIVCTIHQPSAKLFSMFDHIYIVAKGKCVYQGEPDALVPFLSAAGMECPKHYNPADFIIELIDNTIENVRILSNKIDNGKKCQLSNNKNDKLIVNTLVDDSLYKTIIFDPKKDHRKLSTASVANGFYNLSVTQFEYPISKWMQFYFLLARMMKQKFRSWQTLLIQTFNCLICAVAIGCVYQNTANDAKHSINYIKLCVGIVVIISYTQLLVQLLALPFQIKLVKKEIFNRWYAYTPYYAALSVSRLPVQIILNTSFMLIIYFMCNLPREVYRLITFALIGNLVGMCADCFGFTVGTLFNITNGTVVGVGGIAPLLALGIYGLDYSRQIPGFMWPIVYSSFMRDGIVGLVVTIFGYNRSPLDCDDAFCIYGEPRELLDFLDFQEHSVCFDIIVLIVFYCFFRTLSYFTLQQRFISNTFFHKCLKYVNFKISSIR